VKNRKKGFLERLSSLCGALVDCSEKVWKLIVKWKMIVGGVVALAGLILWGYHWLTRQQGTEQHFPDGSVIVTNPARATPLQITLQDGTRVTLAYSSYVRYQTKTDGNIREVTIGGQAEFEVAPDIKPFIVHAGGTDVRVLGTQFNVMNYANEPTTITLLSGRVQVLNPNGSGELKPAQQAIVRDGQFEIKTMSHPRSCLDWANDPPYFYFENDSLGKVLRELERWYDVRVVNPERLAGYPISGKFPRSYTLEEILKSIRLVENDAGLNVEKDENTINVTKRQ
jgi:ferric-dicitrate binding protein FerR (iron transport regulator)